MPRSTMIREEIVQNWSFDVQTARQSYYCNSCDGVIPRGMDYVRTIVREGPKKGEDPLKVEHFHFNCSAPWYQPDTPNHLSNLGRLSRKTKKVTATLSLEGKKEKKRTGITGFPPALFLQQEGLGTVQWQFPRTLLEKLKLQDEATTVAGVAEVQVAFEIFTKVVLAAVGNRHKAKILSNALEELSRTLPLS